MIASDVIGLLRRSTRGGRTARLSRIETVAEIMERDVVAVHPDDDVESLLRLMREHELPGVPVVDASRTAWSGSSPRPTS